ncbi:hypothetical protein B0H17DRAFT_1134760 [Mycena rosella]|uniref:Uncharacterized protein n=1 Tax=Mycena rosella TaxID=1033263 RepID=A0AAD7DF51_MYCRO|nr:hypothetical protein B0H17DRAFT_1134760 [Mycena rosella]
MTNIDFHVAICDILELKSWCLPGSCVYKLKQAWRKRSVLVTEIRGMEIILMKWKWWKSWKEFSEARVGRMHPSFMLQAFADVPLDEDALNFRATRSGQFFSPWITPVSTASSFSIADMVQAAELHSSRNEDLSELDSGPTLPHDLPTCSPWTDEPDLCSTIHTTSPPTTPCKKRSAQTQDTLRELARCKIDILFADRPRHPHHYTSTTPSIKARFELRKICIAATGASLEETVERAEEKVSSPTHCLPDFFGPKAIFHGFHVVEYLASGSRPIVNPIRKVCGIFSDCPPDANFMETVHDPAVEAMEEARASCSISEKRQHHQHGNWANLTASDSMGGGQVQPEVLVNAVINTAVLIALLSNSAFIRYAGFATSACPTTPTSRPFLNGIWCAVTFNLGPWTCMLGHRDYTNLVFGWCAIMVLSNFDYRKRGHLILWDCKLIIQFPPGTTILTPSTALFHSNIPIADDERCYSFTQYTAGGIFWWIENGSLQATLKLVLLGPESMGTTSTNGHIHTHGSTHLSMWVHPPFTHVGMPMCTCNQGAGGSSFAQLIFEFWTPYGALFPALVLLSTCLSIDLPLHLPCSTDPPQHPPCSTDLPHHPSTLLNAHEIHDMVDTDSRGYSYEMEQCIELFKARLGLAARLYLDTHPVIYQINIAGGSVHVLSPLQHAKWLLNRVTSGGIRSQEKGPVQAPESQKRAGYI